MKKQLTAAVTGSPSGGNSAQNLLIFPISNNFSQAAADDPDTGIKQFPQ